MKIKVSEATTDQLDRLVARIVGPQYVCEDEWLPNYSTDWAQGGPIIEREKLCLGRKHQADPEYCPINDQAINCWARTTSGGYLSYGPTLLIAAMRCLVVSKLGDEVEVPEGLT